MTSCQTTRTPATASPSRIGEAVARILRVRPSGRVTARRKVGDLLAGERPGERLRGIREGRAVRRADVKDAGQLGRGEADDWPDGKGIGPVVRGDDPAAGIEEDRGLPDGVERDGRRGHGNLSGGDCIDDPTRETIIPSISSGNRARVGPGTGADPPAGRRDGRSQIHAGAVHGLRRGGEVDMFN